MTKFSIIIPTFNRGYILPNAIKSVQNQTFTDWELIIVDDGSADETSRLVEGFNDSKIRYFYQDNKGAAAARNKGLLEAKADWVVYLDSDDELLPNYLKEVSHAILQNPQMLYGFSMGNRTLELYEDGKLIKSIDDSKDFPPEIKPADIFLRKMHMIANMFHSKSLIAEGFRWDEKMPRYEDWDFFMQIAEAHPDNFVYIPKVLFNYHQRFGGDGIVSNTSYQEWADGFEYVYQKHKKDNLMQGQTWYPAKVIQYTQMQKDFEEGKAPDPKLKYFS